MTLVVQPPNGTLIGFQPDSLRACWGMPCQEPLGPANRMAAGSVLWILAMVDGSQQAKAPGEGHTPRNQCHSLQFFHRAAQYLHAYQYLCRESTCNKCPCLKNIGFWTKNHRSCCLLIWAPEGAQQDLGSTISYTIQCSMTLGLVCSWFEYNICIRAAAPTGTHPATGFLNINRLSM